MNRDRSRLAAFVALAYTLVIVYASLQPFDGWRMPPAALFDFLLAPWPRYITAGDIVLNVAAFLPFGAMLVVALRPRRTGASGIEKATVSVKKESGSTATDTPKREYTAEEKNACSIEAMRNGGTCEACQ